MTDLLPVPRDQEPPTSRMDALARLLKQVAARDFRRRRMVKTVALPAAAVVAVVAAGGLTYVQANNQEQAAGQRQIYTIESSYAFDVHNPSYVAGYADNVFVGTVLGIVDTNADRALTLYEVSVDTIYLGNPGDTAVVSQLGYRDGSNLHVPEDQPLLTEGKTYLLATTNGENGQQTVIAGPQAVTSVTADNRAAVDDKWAKAVRTREFPPGVPRR